MPFSHGVRRSPQGGVVVRLTARERDVLAALPEQIGPVLRGEGGPPWLVERLRPKAYDDEEHEREYQALLGDSLAEERLGKLQAFAETLEAGQTKRLTWSVELDPEQAHAWLSALNDARLVLASILGIHEEADWQRVPEKGSAPSVVLWYLGWLEEELLGALMGPD